MTTTANVYTARVVPSDPLKGWLTTELHNVQRALAPLSSMLTGGFLAGRSTHPGDENYLVISLSGTLDDFIAVCLAYDTSGIDPRLYIANPNGPIILNIMADGVNSHRGLVLPIMTTAIRNAIGSPQVGETIWNTTTGARESWNGAAWV